jgi:Domain found in Dishevelled, Egl-10, and Pleckstrin (DEP)
MLLVKSQEVTYCQVVRRNSAESEILPGLIYLKQLFVRGQSYPKERRQEANEFIRDRFLDSKVKVVSLLVETETELTIFYNDNRALLAIEGAADAVNSNDPLDRIDLQYTISEMRGIGGVKIKDRRYRLRTYSQCFVGSEAVDWMRDRFRISRAEALQLGQRLMDAKHIHHVVDGHEFKDGYFFYRFYWDEDN